MSIRMSGSGDVSIDRLKGDAFDASSSGSGDLTVDEIDVRKAKLAAAGSGDIEIDKVRGKAFEATLVGSGDLSIDSIESDEFKLIVNGSADTSIDEFHGDGSKPCSRVPGIWRWIASRPKASNACACSVRATSRLARAGPRPRRSKRADRATSA